MIKLKDLDVSLLPQEKLLTKGVALLSDQELMAIILRSGIKNKNILELSKEVLNLLKDDFEHISIEKLTNIDGIGTVKACQIIVSIELSKRYLGNLDKKLIVSAEQIVYILNYLKHEKSENIVIVTLDNHSKLIKVNHISKGGFDYSLQHQKIFLK
ncbi:MAG: hypothetical protein HXX81_04335 [Campylobacterales bacterium]|nr:hypothetical protein [Campylobacterales bacterium]